MSIAQELAAEESRRRQAERAGRDQAAARGLDMAARYGPLWRSVTAVIDAFVRDYNESLPTPLADARADGGYACAVTIRRDRAEVVVWVHLNSSSDLIEFTAGRRIALVVTQFDGGVFRCDLRGEDLVVLDV